MVRTVDTDQDKDRNGQPHEDTQVWKTETDEQSRLYRYIKAKILKVTCSMVIILKLEIKSKVNSIYIF